MPARYVAERNLPPTRRHKPGLMNTVCGQVSWFWRVCGKDRTCKSRVVARAVSACVIHTTFRHNAIVVRAQFGPALMGKNVGPVAGYGYETDSFWLGRAPARFNAITLKTHADDLTRNDRRSNASHMACFGRRKARTPIPQESDNASYKRQKRRRVCTFTPGLNVAAGNLAWCA